MLCFAIGRMTIDCKTIGQRDGGQCKLIAVCLALRGCTDPMHGHCKLALIHRQYVSPTA